MGEMQHPPVDLGLARDVSFERMLAEEAFETLTTYGCETERELGSMIMWLLETDVVELRAEGDTDIVFRISNLPVLVQDPGATSVSRPDRTDGSYFVMDIEHGTVSDDIEEATAEDYTWESYVKIIVDCMDLNGVTVLDGKSYKELNSGDLNHALYIMSLIRQEFRGMEFEDEIGAASTDQMQGISFLQVGAGKDGKRRKFTEFESQEFVQSSQCDKCCTVNNPCEHNPATLN